MTVDMRGHVTASRSRRQQIREGRVHLLCQDDLARIAHSHIRFDVLPNPVIINYATCVQGVALPRRLPPTRLGHELFTKLTR